MSRFKVLQARRDGQPVIIVLNDALSPDRDRASFPCLLTIHIPMKSFDPSTGLCDQPEAARLDDVEDALLSPLDGSRFRLVGHVTGNGRREILLYVAEAHSAVAAIHEALADTGEVSATVTARDDPKWDYYHQFL